MYAKDIGPEEKQKPGFNLINFTIISKEKMDILDKKGICLLHKVRNTMIWQSVSNNPQGKVCAVPQSQFI